MAANSQLNLALRIQADMQQAIDQTKVFSRELDDVGRQSGQAGQQLQELANSGAQAEQTLGGATRQLKQMVAGFASLAAIRGAVKIADDYVTMANRIEMATTSAAEYELVQRRLLETANNTYRPLAEAQEVYIRTADALRSMGENTESVLDVTDSFSYLLVTNNASVDKAATALGAYSKAIQTGKLDSLGWISIMTAMPTVVDAIAASSGRAAEDVRKLGVEGKLSIQELNTALKDSLETNKAAADGMYTTVADSYVHLQNALSVYLGEANRSTAATALIGDSIALLADNLDTVANVVLVGLSAATARYVVNLGLATKAAITSTLATRAQTASELQLAQAQVASTLTTANAARAQAGLTMTHAQAKVAVDAHAAAQVRLAAAQRAASGVTALLGGPVGLAMLAASAAASFLLFRDSAVEVRSSLNDLNEPLSSAVKRFQELTKVEQASELDKLNREIKETEETTTNLGRTLANTVNDEIVGAFGLFGKATGDVKDTLELIRKASGDAVRGVAVDWDTVALAIRNTAGMSDEMRSKLLDMIAELVKSGRHASELSARQLELANSSNEAAAGVDNLSASLRAGSAEGDAYLKRMSRQLEDMKDASNIGRLMRDIRDNPDLHDLPKEQLDQLIEIAKERDKLEAARKKSSKNPRSSSDQEAKATESYIKQLEKQAATLDMTAAQLREYELSEKKLTGTLLERAQAAQATIAASEQQKQSAANAKAATDLQVQLLQASGRETEAALLESAQRFAEIQRDMLKTGNDVGLELVQQLIPLDALRVQLSAMQTEIDKALNTQQRREQSIEAQVNSGLITQIEGRKQLVELHRQTADLLEQQLPQLRAMAAMPGVMGEQARIVLETLETQILQLRTTTNELQNALRDGLQNGIAESLSGLAKGTMDLRDAINALLQSVVDSMVQIASQQLAEQATSGLMSMVGSLGGMFGGGAGEAANAGAEAAGGAATAAAITSASTAGAAAMGTSITTAGAGAGTAMATSMATAGAGAGTTMASSITTAGAAAAQAMAAAIASASAASSGGNALSSAAKVATVAAATGGHIRGPGTGTSDSIPAWLSDYEFVSRAAVVKQPGALPFLHDFNQRGMQALYDWSRRIAHHSTGGLAGIPAPAFPAPALGISNIQEPAKNMSTTLNNKIALNLIDSPERIADALNTPAGTEALTVMLSNDPAKYRQILGVN